MRAIISNLPAINVKEIIFVSFIFYMFCIFYLLFKCVKHFMRTFYSLTTNCETENIEMGTFEKVMNNEAIVNEIMNEL